MANKTKQRVRDLVTATGWGYQSLLHLVREGKTDAEILAHVAKQREPAHEAH